MAAHDPIELRSDRENLIALFYEVRQIHERFLQHIQADEEGFKQIATALEDLRLTTAKRGAAEHALLYMFRGVLAIASIFGIGTAISKHWFG
jgi:hypothetical protein